MSLYRPAIAGTHCAYPRRDGQAELTNWGSITYRYNIAVCRWSPI